jgi:hypothetical protein
MKMAAQSEADTSGALLAFYWLIVGVPLLWGVVQTISNAMKLFS